MSDKRPIRPTRLQEGYQPDFRNGYQPETGKIDISLLKPPKGDTAVQPPQSPTPAQPQNPSGGEKSS